MKQGAPSEKCTTAVGVSASAGTPPPSLLTPPEDTPGQLGASQLHGMMQPQDVLLPFPCVQYKMPVN